MLIFGYWQEELEGVEAELEQVERDYAALGEDRKRLKENDQRTRGEMGRLQHELKKHTEEKARLSKAEGQLAAYGDKMERLVNEIKRQAAKFSAPPLGPLGLHVKLKEDATQWAGPVENAIGAAIANFVVRSQKDRALLQDICHKLGCHWVTVITMKPSTTEYRVREPTARGIRSVAQCVSVEEPVVFNALVDWAKIDTSGVFRDHGEAMASCVRDRAGALYVRLHHRHLWCDMRLDHPTTNPTIPPHTGNSAFPFPIKTAYHLDNFQTELKNGNTVVRPCNDRRGGRKLGADKSQLIRDIDREVCVTCRLSAVGLCPPTAPPSPSSPDPTDHPPSTKTDRAVPGRARQQAAGAAGAAGARDAGGGADAAAHGGGT